MSLTQPPRSKEPLPPPNQPYDYPPRTVDNYPPREPQPMLPPMSSLLPRHERMDSGPAHDHSPYPSGPPRSYPPPPPLQEANHPLWLAERDPAAPIKHIYHAPHPPSTSQNPNPIQDPILVPSLTRPPQKYVSLLDTPPSPPRQHRKIQQRSSIKPRAEAERTAGEPIRPNNTYPVVQQPYPPPKSHPHQAPEVHPSPPSPHHQAHQRTHPPPNPPQQTYQPPAPKPTSQPSSTNSMNISGLLSSRPVSPNPCPQPAQPSPPSYSIRMRQQPLAARACGFGERDRRVIDPPPILQMTVDAPNATPDEMRALLRQPCAVVHCTLWDPINDKDDTAMPGSTDKRQQRRLMGTLVSSPFVGNDEHNIEGCFFTFPDLSVRTPGKYSLRFSLMIIDPMQMMKGHSVPVSSVVFSDTFSVYNAKDFGGMRPSTELTKRLKHQGCLISVKKGNAKTGAGSRDDDDDDEDDDDADMDDRRRRPAKRVKR